jgi:hypothetical protein
MRPRFDERRRHWAGIVSDRVRVGFVYEVAPATIIGDTAIARPLWPSFGVVVQRN